MSHTDYLEHIRTQLNYWRRAERQYKKQIQGRCFHQHVVHKLPKLPMPTKFDPYSPISEKVRVRVYCRDCGKRLA